MGLDPAHSALLNVSAAERALARAFAAADQIHDPTLFELLAIASLVTTHARERITALVDEDELDAYAAEVSA